MAYAVAKDGEILPGVDSNWIYSLHRAGRVKKIVLDGTFALFYIDLAMHSHIAVEYASVEVRDSIINRKYKSVPKVNKDTEVTR